MKLKPFLAAVCATMLLIGLPALGHAASKGKTIDTELRKLFPANRPGAAVLVQRHGVTLLNKGYGLANVELHVPMRADHIFFGASVGKQFTAAAILKLRDDGRLDLQSPIRRYFPQIPTSWSGITVEHLLQHTSGIANLFKDPEFRRDAFAAHTPQQLLEQAISMPLSAEPGTQFSYASVNYTLLAMIIEQVSGQPYDAYLDQVFFVPLGMRHTHFIRANESIPGLVTPYEKDQHLAVRWHSSLLFGGGSYALNNADLARWTAALHDGTLVTPASLKAMNQALTLPDGGSKPYGYGLRPHTLAGQPYLRSSGDIQGFHAEVVYLPKTRVLVSILANSDDVPKFGLLATARRVAMIAADMPRRRANPVTLPEQVLQARAGVYRHGDDSYAVRVDRGRLMVQYPQGAAWEPLQALSPTEFCYEANSDYRIRFTLQADGRQSSQWFETDPLDATADPVFTR